jgi:branched-chain amino acid transport system permease protein
MAPGRRDDADQSFGGWVTVVQGAVFVVCVLAFRQGIIGKLSAALKLPL